jgi:hypothetical protein
MEQLQSHMPKGLLHPKKMFTSFPSPAGRDVTNQTPPGQEKFSYDVIIPAQGEFGSDIPAGDGKLANLFLRCNIWLNICAIPHILGSPSSYMTLQLFHYEFP